MAVVVLLYLESAEKTSEEKTAWCGGLVVEEKMGEGEGECETSHPVRRYTPTVLADYGSI